MTKSDLQYQLKETVNNCRFAALSADTNMFFINFNDKWSIGENLMHLTKSAKGVNKALAMPKEQLIVFGKPTQPSGTYQDILERYEKVLANGVKATAGFVAQYTEGDTLEHTLSKFDAQHHTLIAALDTFSEEDLDNYQLPHPVLGNLTLREMYYFMDLHIRHHHKTMERIVMREA